VAAANRTDAHHAASVAALATAEPPQLVPGMDIAEVSYLPARDAPAPRSKPKRCGFRTKGATAVASTRAAG
jgi:hypothetical protein